MVVLAFGVQASGVFELELIKLESNNLMLRNKSTDHHFAPDHSPPTIALNQQQQQQQLRTAATDSDEKLKRVFVCLKEPFTSHLVDGPCTFGNASIIVGQQDSSNSQTDSPGPAAVGEQQQQGSLLTNIVRIPITFKWTVSYLLFGAFSSSRRENFSPGEQSCGGVSLIMSATLVAVHHVISFGASSVIVIRQLRTGSIRTSSMTRII